MESLRLTTTDPPASAGMTSQSVNAGVSVPSSDALTLAEARRVLEQIGRLADAALKKGAPHPQPHLKRIREMAAHGLRRLSQP